VQGHDAGGTKHVRVKGQSQERIFGGAFHARPHGAAFFGAIGAHAGDVDEGHRGIEACEKACSGEGDIEGDVAVVGFLHSHGGDAQAEEAGVDLRPVFFEGREIEEVGYDEFAELGVGLRGGLAHHGGDGGDVGTEEAFAQDALADHSGCAEEKYVHIFIRLSGWKTFTACEDRIFTGGNFNVGRSRAFGEAARSSRQPDCSLVYIGEVHYLDYESDFVPEGNAFSPLLHKRKSFSHENEVRALIHSLGAGGVTQPSVAEYGLDVPVALDVLIERVFIAPTTPPWIFRAIIGMLGRYGLNELISASALSDDPIF